MNDSDFSKTPFSLFDSCFYNSGVQENDCFVGLKYENECLKINFPLGYSKANTEKELKKDILNLIGVLSAIGNSNESFLQKQKFAKKENAVFPIHAYLFLIKDFLNSGYYFETETKYSRSSQGKISWAKTIKQVKPLILNGEIFYLDFIARKSAHNENELISQIHRYCVHESFSKIGWLFSDFIPPKPNLPFNRNLFLSVIRKKISQTFNEKNIILFNYMIDIIEYLDKSSESKDFIYGTNTFQTAWEIMVDSAFGKSDKQKYYPHYVWHIGEKSYSSEQLEFKKSALRPDTIMITGRGSENQKIFVLDSKYYRYGVTRNPCDLPSSGSIIKQVAYAEYIETQESKSELHPASKAIYNAFILPFDSNALDAKMKCVGFVETDYKSGDKSYNKIKAILLDTKSIMQNYCRSEKLISGLAELIESKS